MKPLLIRSLCLVCALSFSLKARGESASQPLNPDMINSIIKELSTELSNNYVHKPKADDYVHSLSKISPSHKLFTITDPDIFKVAITDFLQAVHPDGHLRVYDPKTTARILKNSNFDEDHDSHTEGREEFLELKHKDSSYAHLKISSLPNGETYEVEAVQMLAGLSDIGMLVLDLRSNTGGSARTVRRMLDCLLPEATPLYRLMVSVGKDKGEHEHHSKPISACQSISNTPITVLVDDETASAAELLALLIKNRKRGLVLGQQTYGAGNPVELFRLPHGYSVYIPISTIVDSISGEGFELTGVEPDIKL